MEKKNTNWLNTNTILLRKNSQGKQASTEARRKLKG